MNRTLAEFLLDLSDPAVHNNFQKDPSRFLDGCDLSPVDKKIVVTRNRALLKYQARFGDLTIADLSNQAVAYGEAEHEHVEIGPEHEEDHEHDEVDTARTTATMRAFGPHTRFLDPANNSEHTEVLPSHPNSLVIVGTGLSAGHLTREAATWISSAGVLLYCVADAATEVQLQRLNGKYEDLYHFYGNGKPRRDTYREMADRILEVLRNGTDVCVAFYGHPGLFVKPAHLAIKQARLEGYSAFMCPSASTIDCLIADLGIDLSWDGCTILEATHFLVRNKQPDIESGLILLQVGCVGDSSFSAKGFDGRHFPVLCSRLSDIYGPDHMVVLYEASQFTICPPRVDLVFLKNLESVRISGITTIYIPPVRKAPVNNELSQFFSENQPLYS